MYGYAETIENNVRSKIIEEQLNDPAYFERMSDLLDEVIAARKQGAIDYEEYLKRVADIAAKVEKGQADDAPPQLNTPGKRALYNNLQAILAEAATGAVAGEAVHETVSSYSETKDRILELAIEIDVKVKTVRPSAWRGIQARERVIKAALYEILKDIDQVERVFSIVKAQKEY